MSPALRSPIRTVSRSSPRFLSKNLASSEKLSIVTHQDSIERKNVSVHLTRSQSLEENVDNRFRCSENAERFPVCSRSASTVSLSTENLLTSTKSCQWFGCDIEIGPRGLLSHIQESHVLPQIPSKKGRFTCMWIGCKVYGQPSVSTNWLSRHVQQHSEAKGKPFSCIFDRCCKRFSSSTLLQRHIDRDHSQHDIAASSAAASYQASFSSLNYRPSISGFGYKNPVSVKSCYRRSGKRRRKLRYYRVRHTDFYDLRSKTIIKNRLVLDKLLAESAIEKLITHPETTPSDSQVTAVVPLPRPIREDFSESPKKRYLRSNDNGVPFSTKLLSSKPESYRVKLLLTVPHIFVGQRLTADNRTEYLVKWQGVLCADALPVMWVLEEEVHAAAALDKL